FFSSRRRHTRCLSDWSSDVCSSDLWFVTALGILTFAMPWLINKKPAKEPIDYQPLVLWLMFSIWIALGNAMHHLWPAVAVTLVRSEERRVGKGGRCCGEGGR